MEEEGMKKKDFLEVEEFFKEIGFETKNNGSSVVAKGEIPRTKTKNQKIEVVFSYSESCNNVYKHISVSRDGKSSNITVIKNYLKKLNA